MRILKLIGQEYARTFIETRLFDSVRNGKAGYGLLMKSASPFPATLAREEHPVRRESPHDAEHLLSDGSKNDARSFRLHMEGWAFFPRRRRSDSMRASREEGICSIGGISDRMVWSAVPVAILQSTTGIDGSRGCRPLAVIICSCRRERRWLREPLRWRRR